MLLKSDTVPVRTSKLAVKHAHSMHMHAHFVTQLALVEQGSTLLLQKR